MLTVGDVLVGRYRIVNRLGQGASGAVYRAWDVRDGRDMAVKLLHDPNGALQRPLRAEVRALSGLRHPQLPTVLDHFSLDGVGQCLVSTYVDGVDLQQLATQFHPLPEERVVAWLQAAVQPLAWLHARGRLHLDVKPANLRLTPQGEIVLVDGGLPGLGLTAGTPGYAAPEQQALRGASPASDIYGLGATLYTLLTAQVPVTAAHREAGLADLRPARDVNPQVAPYLSLAAARALALRPDARYETAEAFGQALARPADGRSGQAERPATPLPAVAPPPRVPLNPRRRRQIEMRTIYGLAGVLVVLLALAYWLARLGLGSAAPAAATATAPSELALALTQLAPVPSPTFDPALQPTPTPEALVDPLTEARLIYIPGGVFRMGNDEGARDERPSHMVRLDAYFIDETEVTNAAYARCVAAEVCTPPQRLGATFHPSYYGDPLYDDYPVIFVNWGQAAQFCAWRGGRLPTEAEWEYAAGYRPAVARMMRYPWGEVMTGPLDNFCDRNCTRAERNVELDDGYRDTAPVRAFPDGRSAFGLYSMAGNVLEWVADWYDADYYRASAAVNPMGPTQGTARAIRGGSWLSTQEDLVVTARSAFVPEVARANLGFRCAQTPP